jgi:ribosome-associated translation inhibitor RaiA
MKQRFCFFLMTGVLFAACHGDGHQTQTATTRAITSLEDSLYKDVIALHDETMPKMGKIIGYKKAIQLKIDSLNAYLATKKDKGAAALKEEYQNLLVQLNTAEKGMNDWMDGFDPDPQLPTKKELVTYFEDQKLKAKKMKDDIFSALDSAAAKLPK